jgi:PAS domain S-box-containing protein
MKEDLSETLTPASLQQVQEEMAVGLAAVEQGQMEKTLRLEIEQYRKDGSTVWVEIAVSALIDDDGKLLGFIGISRDIAERRKVEEALRDSEKLYRSLFENMHNGFAYCKMLFEQNQPRDFIYLSVNSAFEKQTGLNDVSGKKVSEVIPGIYESDRQLIETYGRVALTGVPETFETYLAALDMWFSISVYSPAKEYFVAIFDVITERKRAEAYREMVREVLQILNDPGDLRDSIQRVLAAMKTRTGFDAVGIRLQDGDDFPYFAQDGFPKDFLVTENTLTERGADGGLCRNKDGSVSLECTCGLVISGKTDPDNPIS